MEPSADDRQTYILHTERTTISDGRYLIYYTFGRPSDRPADESEGSKNSSDHGSKN